ncbi:PPC domain-containing DNA-binding protein [Streptomyces shenzhenensis]
MLARPTLFRVLLEERRWDNWVVFCEHFERAAREVALKSNSPRITGVTVGRRTFDRWFAGDLYSGPQHDAARVLEHLFEFSCTELFGPPDVSAAAGSAPSTGNFRSWPTCGAAPTEQPSSTPSPRTADYASGGFFMRSTKITRGREFVLAIDHGEDFFDALKKFCTENEVRSGYIPTFIGGFRHARLVGMCGAMDNPEAPLWDAVEVQTLEALGGGTLAWDTERDRLAPHIHVSAGLKESSADGRTSHLLAAEVQFIAELLVVEIAAPTLTRPRLASLYDVPLLTFDQQD